MRAAFPRSGEFLSHSDRNSPILALGAAVAVFLALAAAASPATAQQPRIPIPGPLDGPLPRFEGEATEANPLKGTLPPANRALAPDGRSGSGLAPGNGGASPYPGPLGNGTTGTSSLQFGTCASFAFDADDRLLTVCNGPLGPSLRLVDPASLGTIATLTLPGFPGRGPLDRTNLAGGTHFVLGRDGTLLVPTFESELIRVAVEGDSLRQTGSVDLGGLLGGSERPFAVAAGFDGRDWVAGNQGTIVSLPRGGGEPQTLALGEPVAEDIATDPTGTYVVTREALYRLRAGDSGKPRIVWRHPLPVGVNDTNAGRIHPGPGTPPVIIAGRWVAVADELNPPRVTVLRIDGPAVKRLACAVPVFKPGRGSIESHLVVAGRSIVATNAYGYTFPLSTEGGRTSVGGMARVVVTRRGCRTAWESGWISPSAQPVVSRETGLLYTLVKPPGFPDAWNLAAIDWRSGNLHFQALAGEGLGYNSEGGALVLGPDGTAYAGTFGGLVGFRDAGK